MTSPQLKFCLVDRKVFRLDISLSEFYFHYRYINRFLITFNKRLVFFNLQCVVTRNLYRSFATTVSQPQVCHNHNSVTTTTVPQPQQYHNHNSATTTTVSQPQECHNHKSATTTTVSQPQQCYNHNSVTTTTVPQPQQCHNHNSATTTTVSQPQQCHNSKFVIFQERHLKILKCYNFLWGQQRHNCSPAASFANCVMTYLLKVHLQTFLSIPVTQKCQILSCDTLVANERLLP
jgi:hypothetical protein